MTFYLAGSVETHRESHIHPYVHICTHYHLKRAPKYIEAGAADILYTEDVVTHKECRLNYAYIYSYTLAGIRIYLGVYSCEHVHKYRRI